MTDPDATRAAPGDQPGAGVTGSQHHVELVGPQLRFRGRISMSRFSLVSDLVNHNRGCIVLHEAHLLGRDGTPAAVAIPELVVRQDEITFIGHAADFGADFDAGGHLVAAAEPDRSVPDRQLRHFVIFTPGHTITGSMHVYREMTLANFVEATDPRFLPMADATAHSLADRRVTSHFRQLLVNRTHINAMAESEQGHEIAEAAVQGGP